MRGIPIPIAISGYLWGFDSIGNDFSIFYENGNYSMRQALGAYPFLMKFFRILLVSKQMNVLIRRLVVSSTWANFYNRTGSDFSISQI